MKSFLTILLLFLSLPFAVKAGFPEGKYGFNIKKVIPRITNQPEEELNGKSIEELKDSYPKWYLHTLEEIRRGK